MTAADLVAALGARGQTIATAESLTGGLLGGAITSVPGSSAVYLGGVVVYATRLKATLAGVDAEVLLADGAVSRRTAEQLAAGARRLTGADWGIATTGVAGPDPQEGHAPGTVWIGWAGPSHALRARLFLFEGDREAVRAQTVAAALSILATEVGAQPGVEGTSGARAAL